MRNDRNSTRKDDVVGKHGLPMEHIWSVITQNQNKETTVATAGPNKALIKNELTQCISAGLPEPPFDFLITNNVSQLHKTVYKYRLMKRHGCPVGANKDCRTAV